MITREQALGARRRIITGSTGFVGSHFALACCRAGNAPIALARGDSEVAARERVMRALAVAERSLGDDRTPYAVPPLVLAADLAQPACGISGEALIRLRRSQPEQFWHFAASLRYEDRHQAEIFESNLQGTLRALELAKLSGCTTFVYVSTAYSAGKQRGPVSEQLHDSALGFNNAYEESKARAEHAVATFCGREQLSFAILRPSIVIGPHATKRTGGSSTGLYGFLREVSHIAAALRALGRPVEVNGDPRTLCNLIPVDWFVDDVCAILEGGLCDGGVYHNTCERPLTISEVGEVVASALDIPGFDIQPRATLMSPLEQRLARRTAFYGAYFSNSKHFIRERSGARELSRLDLSEYVREFLAELSATAVAAASTSIRADA